MSDLRLILESNKNLVAEYCLNNIQDMVIFISHNGQLLYANAPALAFYGYDLESFTRLGIHDIDPNFPISAWRQHWEALKRKQHLLITVQHRDKHGHYQPVEIIDSYQCLDDQEFSICVIRAISHRDDRNRRIQLMEFSVDSMLDSAMWVDSESRILFANDATCRNLGYAHDELIGMSIHDIDSNMTKESWRSGWVKLLRKKSMTFEAVYLKKSGEKLPVEVNANYLKVHDQEISCVFVRDITDRKMHEQELVRIATHDALTGIPNRACLYDRAEHAILINKRNGSYCSLMIVDLDRFKLVNDTLGHDAGDYLLKVLSSRMVALLRESDTVARLGGDEFAIFIDSIEKVDECAVLADRVVKAVAEPVNYKGKIIRPGASIGIAIAPNDADDISSLLKCSDIAMYQAKREGGNQYRFYEPEMGKRIAKHIEIVNGLQRALDCRHFTLHYQPVYDFKTNELVSAEALIRWLDPDRGLVPPMEFIPIAEESDLILAIGAWVIEEICRQNREWKMQGFNIVPIAFNMSARQLQTYDIVNYIQEKIGQYGLNYSALSVEITESMVMEDPEAATKIIKQLRDLGVRVAIDDFGTGYSSLSYLQQFAFDVIKIDRSFVDRISGTNEDTVIANAIINLAHGLGRQVLAEGVETEFQRDYLRSRGCDLAQGFFYDKPLPAEEFAKLIERNIKRYSLVK